MVLASSAECSYLTKQLMFHVEHQLEAPSLVNFTSNAERDAIPSSFEAKFPKFNQPDFRAKTRFPLFPCGFPTQSHDHSAGGWLMRDPFDREGWLFELKWMDLKRRLLRGRQEKDDGVPESAIHIVMTNAYGGRVRRCNPASRDS
jgi:hypothetical protein